jgi:hypothetical protein
MDEQKKQAEYAELKAKLDEDFRIAEYRERLNGLKRYLGMLGTDDEPTGIPLSMLSIPTPSKPKSIGELIIEGRTASARPSDTSAVRDAIRHFRDEYSVKDVSELLIRQGLDIEPPTISRILWRFAESGEIKKIRSGGKEGNVYENT